jgi:RNA polymerase sigma factor (sigma-70 family)
LNTERPSEMLHCKMTGTKAAAGTDTAEDPDEAALLALVAQGDGAAFEALFRRYRPRLSRFLEPMTRRRPQLVDEILNDTMLVVWRKAATLRLRSKVSTWIIGIAWRRGMKALGQSGELATGVDHDSTATAAECGPEEASQRRQLRTRLNRALRDLSAEQRPVVELTYYKGHTYREIATIVDCPVDTVKTRMFHARRRLKLLLADGAEEAA